jgi:peroxiredoxin
MTDQQHPAVGERAPDLVLPNLAGTLASLESVRAQHHVVIHFVREFT